MTDVNARLPIRLGQLLKLAGMVESGAHARDLIESGDVEVNGEVCTQRGRQLSDGDTVSVHGETITVTPSA
ncbi:RNA-binding S4 domain-containing protein [Flaviflexus huanghaiensis]|uniref:RNA-binding S4 domain-containing protein n=1 Tax=Flaviflexus huanghaiensis TaxID=1111473 RepID=UPI0015F9C54D|nr:RNA-binding S4 domain-containing protein [Flaviflexus huanghaiensis]